MTQRQRTAALSLALITAGWAAGMGHIQETVKTRRAAVTHQAVMSCLYANQCTPAALEALKRN